MTGMLPEADSLRSMMETKRIDLATGFEEADLGPVDSEQLVVEFSDAGGVGIAAADPDVVERREPVADP